MRTPHLMAVLAVAAKRGALLGNVGAHYCTRLVVLRLSHLRQKFNIIIIIIPASALKTRAATQRMALGAAGVAAHACERCLGVPE